MSSENGRKVFRHEDVQPCTAAFAAFLRNKFPTNTVYWVSSKTGINPATVEKWLYEKSLPHLRHWGPLMSLCGPDVVKAMYPQAPAWVEEAWRLQQRDELVRRRDEAEAQLREYDGET